MSAPGNFAKRNIIRRTWRNHYQQHKSLGLIDTAGFAFILAMTKENVTQKQIDKERAKLIEILFKWTKYRLLTLLLVSCIGCTQTGPKLILYSK
jgi:RNase P protein component